MTGELIIPSGVTSVLSGSIRMAATACGEASLIERKQGGIEIDATAKLPAVAKLRLRARNTSLIMLACVMILTALSIFFGEDVSLPDVFLGAVAMAVAAMSEFLTVIATIAVAVGVRDAANRKNLSIRCPEKLESIRDIKRIVFCGSSFFKSGRSELYACRVNGKYYKFTSMPESGKRAVEEIVSLAMTASADSNTGIATGHFAEINNTAMDAVIRRAATSLADNGLDIKTNSYKIFDHKDADKENTQSLQLSLIEYNNDVCAVGVGKVADVLACCSAMDGKDGEVPLTAALRKEILTECARLEFGGASVLAVSVRRSPYMNLNRAAVLTANMIFKGFFAVAEEPEKNVKQSLQYIKDKKIVPIIFTENPDADLYYCHRLRLFGKNTVRVKMSELTAEMVDSFDENGAIVSFEGVSKARLAQSLAKTMKTVMHDRDADTDAILQDDGKETSITAAVGREIRDSGVLAAADVGFAVSGSSMKAIPSTLASQASVLVKINDSPSTEHGVGGISGVIGAVEAASVMFSNMEAAKTYLTASQCARLAVMLSSIIFGIPLLSPVFILVWGLLFDFAAILMMAFASPKSDVYIDNSIQLRKRSRPIIDGIVWGASLSGWSVILSILSKLLEFDLSSAEEVAILASSAIITGMVCSVTSLRRIYSWHDLRLHTAGAMFFASAVALASVVVLAPLPIIGGAFCGVKALFALVPALVPIGIFGVESLARRVKFNK
ncbi:MAG: cation-transporting P-type ATPase [Clostridia bacterium]|nr:cation-transporting P-type ATPase [Clostridia bacterium]